MSLCPCGCGHEVMRIRVTPGGPHHSDGFIIGERGAIERLRQACDDALTNGAGSAIVSDDDGESYELHVALPGVILGSDSFVLPEGEGIDIEDLKCTCKLEAGDDFFCAVGARVDDHVLGGTCKADLPIKWTKLAPLVDDPKEGG